MKANQGTKNNAVKAVANVCLASYQKLAAQIERVRQHLLDELRGTMEAPERLFRLALNEAEALAWQTEYPLLVFPMLATEKVQGVVSWEKRQRAVSRIYNATLSGQRK